MLSFLGALQRALIPVLALLLLCIALLFDWSGVWLALVVILTVPGILLGIYDLMQNQLTLTRNYPVAARIRWLFYDLRPFLRQYIVEGDLEGTPYSFEARNLVNARARGKIETHPFGSDRNMNEAGYAWISHSMSPTAEAD